MPDGPGEVPFACEGVDGSCGALVDVEERHDDTLTAE